MVVNQRPRLSPTLFEQLMNYAVLKVDFHNVSIRARKDPELTWCLFPYLVSEMEVQEVVGYFPTKWCEPTKLYV